MELGRKFDFSAVVDKLCSGILTKNKQSCNDRVFKSQDRWQKLAASVPPAVVHCMQDIIADEVDKSGLAKAEDFLKQKQHQNGSVRDIDTYSDINYTPARASSDINNTSSRAANHSHTSAWAMDNQQVSEEELENDRHATSKYEALIKSQMAHTKSDFEEFLSAGTEGETNGVIQTSNLNGRRSPIGEDGANQYQDGDESALKTIDMCRVERSEGFNGANWNGSLVEDDVERKSVMSSTSTTHTPRSTPQAVVDDVLGNGHNRTPIYSTESPVHSRHSSAHSSLRQTPNSETHSATREPGRAEYSNLTNNLMDDLLHDAVDRTMTPPNTREGSQNASARQMPQLEQISDVLNPADRHSPIRREYLVGSPHQSDNSNHNSIPNSANSSQRQTPQKDMISNSLRSGQEKLYTNQGYRRIGSDHGSVRSDSSRPQSLTSEQELTQYYDNTSDPHRVSSAPGTPVQASPSIPAVSGSPRAASASSLPAIGSQQRHSADRRSATPDNYIRVPATVKGPLLPNRQTPTRATPVSNASSRTVTPVNQTEAQEISRLQERILDLENTVGNLRKLLSSREQEVAELSGQLRDVKDINKVLQEELDHRRARASPGPQIAELERKYRDVLAEKEALNTDILHLQDKLRDRDTPGLNSYDPNSRSALQRKIDEMSSQVQDLQEANESAVDDLTGLEAKVKELQGRNDELQDTHASSTLDLQDNNDRLNQEIVKLKDQSSHTEVTDYRLKIELQQVKEDNRGLRERNYQLHDDNLKLKDELTDLRKSMEAVEASRKSYTTDNFRSRPADTYERSDHSSRDRTLGAERDNGTKYSPTKSLYDGKVTYDSQTDQGRSETIYKAEMLSKTESSRYESYRSGPEGGSGDKLTQSRPRYDTRPPLPIPERPSALGPPKTEYSNSPQSLDRQRLDREESDHNRRDRRRTASADVNYKSLPLSSYSELAKTTPALSGRSRAIYKQLSNLRSRSRSRSPGNRSRGNCESPPDNPESSSDNQNRSKSSKIFFNRFIPPNEQSPQKSDDEVKHHTAPDRVDLTYTRAVPPTSQHRHGDTYKREDKSYEPRPLPPQYPDEGDISDTATDILVSAQPLDRVPNGWAQNRQRRGSVGSDASNSSFSDIDEQITSVIRKRSKSADGREILRRMGPSGTLSRSGPTTPVKGERMTMKTSPLPVKTGFRSITPTPLTTQHNKSALSFSHGSISLTQGLRPFAPRSAGDLQINDVIKFSRQGGKLSQGTIKFIGHLPGRGDIYLGVELDKEDGKHDGTFEDIRYFKCKPTKGVFVAYNKVVMAWTCY